MKWYCKNMNIDMIRAMCPFEVKNFSEVSWSDIFDTGGPFFLLHDLRINERLFQKLFSELTIAAAV